MQWGSIIAGAAGGLGNGMATLAKDQIETDRKTSLMQMQSDLERQRDEAAMRFKANLQQEMADKERTAMVGRIDEARSGIISSQLNDKYAQSDAAVADADAGKTDAPLTDEQRKVIEDSKTADRRKLEQDPDTYTQAAMKTGDLDPKTAATLNSRENNAAARAEAILERAKLQNEAAHYKADMAKQLADLREQHRSAKSQGDANNRTYMSGLQRAVSSAQRTYDGLNKKDTSLMSDDDKAKHDQAVQDAASAVADAQAELRDFAKEIGIKVPERNGGAGSGGAGGGKVRAPAIGAIVGGYRFKGGNLNDKNNWEKV